MANFKLLLDQGEPRRSTLHPQPAPLSAPSAADARQGCLAAMQWLFITLFSEPPPLLLASSLSKLKPFLSRCLHLVSTSAPLHAPRRKQGPSKAVKKVQQLPWERWQDRETNRVIALLEAEADSDDFKPASHACQKPACIHISRTQRSQGGPNFLSKNWAAVISPSEVCSMH